MFQGLKKWHEIYPAYFSIIKVIVNALEIDLTLAGINFKE